jgi:hypothetical protein
MVGESWRNRKSVKTVASMGWSVMAQRAMATRRARRGKVSGRPPGPARSALFHWATASRRGEPSIRATAHHTRSSDSWPAGVRNRSWNATPSVATVAAASCGTASDHPRQHPSNLGLVRGSGEADVLGKLDRRHPRGPLQDAERGAGAQLADQPGDAAPLDSELGPLLPVTASDESQNVVPTDPGALGAKERSWRPAGCAPSLRSDGSWSSARRAQPSTSPGTRPLPRSNRTSGASSARVWRSGG